MKQVIFIDKETGLLTLRSQDSNPGFQYSFHYNINAFVPLFIRKNIDWPTTPTLPPLEVIENQIGHLYGSPLCKPETLIV